MVEKVTIEEYRISIVEILTGAGVPAKYHDLVEQLHFEGESYSLYDLCVRYKPLPENETFFEASKKRGELIKFMTTLVYPYIYKMLQEQKLIKLDDGKLTYFSSNR
jgi:hypothetical protein